METEAQSAPAPAPEPTLGETSQQVNKVEQTQEAQRSARDSLPRCNQVRP